MRTADDSQKMPLVGVGGTHSRAMISSPPTTRRRPSDPALRLVITSKSDEVRGAVGRTIVERGWTLLEVSPIALTLEDLFVKLVRGEPH